MKGIILFSVFIFSALYANSQTCDELMRYVKSKGYGTTYTSYNSDAISKVTFYNISVDYKSYYDAVVCFKGKYSISCNEYIYQVGSNTKMNYSMNYMNSAGKAFWNYIEPHGNNLNCGPNL